MSTDVDGFWSIQGFLYEIGDIIVVLRNFRSYSCDFSYYSSGFKSFSTAMSTDVDGFWSIQGFLYEIGDIIVVLGNSFRPYCRDCSSHYFSGFRSYSCEMKTEVQCFFRGFQYEIEENIVVLMNFRSSRNFSPYSNGFRSSST